jgi:hypothetical protein
MAKKAAAKGRAGSPLPAAGLQMDDGAHGVSRPTKPAKPSSLLDTRVVYCGDNLEQLAKLPDACVDLIYIDPPFNSNRNYGPCRTGQRNSALRTPYSAIALAGSFYYHCDWHASHYVKVMLN